MTLQGILVLAFVLIAHGSITTIVMSDRDDPLPSMRTLRASFSTLSVEMRTKIQKMNVQMGSAIFHSG